MAELAVALPAVILVLCLAVSALVLGIDQLRCVDAARVAARAASRGDTEAEVLQAGQRLAPPGARVSARRSGGLVTVEVRGTSRGALSWLPSVEPGAAAVAPVEEGL